MCRSFYDLLVVKILEKIIKYWAIHVMASCATWHSQALKG